MQSSFKCIAQMACSRYNKESLVMHSEKHPKIHDVFIAKSFLICSINS